MQQLIHLGFPDPEDPQHQAALRRAFDLAETVPSPHGNYRVWKSGSGAQIWFQADADSRYPACLPHFEGSGCMDFGVTAWHSAAAERPLHGSAAGWAGGEIDQDEHGAPTVYGDYPLQIGLVDFANWSQRPLPLVVHLRLTAFAARCMAVTDEEDLEELEDFSGLRLESEDFLPAEDNQLNLISGRILDAALLTNELTGQAFYWAWVRVQNGELDLVVHPDCLTGELLPDGFLQAEVWLAGRIIKVEE